MDNAKKSEDQSPARVETSSRPVALRFKQPAAGAGGDVLRSGGLLLSERKKTKSLGNGRPPSGGRLAVRENLESRQRSAARGRPICCQAESRVRDRAGVGPSTVVPRTNGVQNQLNLRTQLLTVDHSARGSMKTAANCASACESQDYQMHRPVERTLRRRHHPVLSPLPDEGLLPYEHPSRGPSGPRA